MSYLSHVHVWRASLMLTLLVCACSADASGPSACEVGPSIYQPAVSALFTSQPACRSDADCVVLDTSVHCAGYDVESCPAVLHRDVAATWDAGHICDEIAAESSPSDSSCSVEASCISAGTPACRAQRCVGTR